MKVIDSGSAEVHLHIGANVFQAAGKTYTGFRFYQDKVYAVSRFGGSETCEEIVISGFYTEDPHVYRIEFVSGVRIDFYVDGVLRKTITTNLPEGDSTTTPCFFGVRGPVGGGTVYAAIFHVLFSQES
jgi:hypothetical protein